VTTTVRREPTLRRSALAARLFAPVDIASLVVFRIAFGAVMAIEAYRYLSSGWIRRYWIDPQFYFTFQGFDWVHPWGGNGMFVHFGVLGALALCVMAGLCYRLTTALFFVGFTYVFLLDKTNYLNHFYLICLLALVLFVVPAHRSFSIDARINPALRSATVPAWALWLVRFQVGIAYFFGGIAKLNNDWLHGEPLRHWLLDSMDFPVIGRWFDAPVMPYLFSYGGLALDLGAVPLLLWRRSRPFMFAALVAFHLTNTQLFNIGIFPYLMLGATTIFFAPDWPRRALALIGRGLGLDPPKEREPAPPPPPVARLRPAQWALVAFLGLFAAYNVLMPLRHFAYPGQVHWTEEGHRFAWHMKLRDKEAQDAVFVVTQPGGKVSEVQAAEFLTPRQVVKMSTRPDMILQAAHEVARRARAAGEGAVQVRARTSVSLNGRPPQPLVDPKVDLAAQPRTIGHASWIVPLRGG
jgi:vitamin K-dependent gamma-carboxylase-like protein